MSDPVVRLNAALEGRYRIERELGQGGMATVYLAQDLKHERRVALKVLRPELAAVVGAERFLVEIKTTANLNHPHILPLHDSGEADGFLFYVMPHLEGESLRERLDRERQLPVAEAVRIATAVAHALEHAHRHGVIHRDIKPANILFQDAEPVVADFGIALAVGVAGGTRLTETGLSLGTPYYMSPEQATGDQVVGPATDTYALGCVLYEMLVGEPPYTGSTAQAVLGKILQGKLVPTTSVRSSIPSNVDAAVRCAIEKLPADRFPTAGDLVRALQDPHFRHGEEGPEASSVRVRVWKRTALATGSTALVFAAAFAWAFQRPAPPQPVERYALAFATGQGLVDASEPTFDVAPDGSWIVYVGPGAQGGRLWVKPRDRYEATALSGTEGARGPSVSPDGQWIAFISRGGLRKIPSGGGPLVTLVDTVRFRGPAAWFDDGTVGYIDPAYGVGRVRWDGGAPEVLLPSDSLLSGYVAPLPGSRGALVGRCDRGCRSMPQVWVLDLRTLEARRIVSGAGWAKYLDTGHIVYARADGALFALPFDPASLEVTGEAVPLLVRVKIDGGQGGLPDIAISDEGTVLMIAPPQPADTASLSLSEAIWVDREGAVAPVDPGWRFTNARNFGWALSPDHTRLAIGLHGDEGDDIWIKELDDGPLTRITFDPEEDARPAWTPDGQFVYFSARSGRGISVQRTDGAGNAVLVVSGRGYFEVGVSRDGSWLLARVGGVAGAAGGRDIVGYRLDQDAAEVPLLVAEYDEVSPQLSPDGRWLAYASQETGRFEIYVRPFPDVQAARWQVSTAGGTSPVWSHRGGELFYVAADGTMVSATVETRPTFRVVGRRTLFLLPAGLVASSLYAWFDLSADDRRFLMVRAVPGQPPLQTQQVRPILVRNWFEEVRRLVRE